MKKIHIFLLIMYIVSPLYSSGHREPENEVNHPLDRTVKIMWWGDLNRQEKTERILEIYESDHPEIHFQTIYSPWSSYWDKLYSLIAADEAPDIYQMVQERMPLFAEKGLLADLYQLKSLDLTGINANVLESMEIEDRLPGLPLGLNALSLCYNPVLIEQSGMTYPEKNWTWESIYDFGREFTSRTGLYALDTVSANNIFFYYLRSRGYSVFNEDLTGPGWPIEVTEDWFNLILKFQDEGIIPPPDKWLGSRASEENSLYAKEQAAMKVMWSNRIISVSHQLKKPSLLDRIPGWDKPGDIEIRTSMLFSISEPAEDKESLASFLSFFIHSPEVNRILNNDRGIPVVREVREEMRETMDIQNLHIYDFIDQSEDIVPGRIASPVKEDIIRALYDEIIKKIRYRMISVPDGARELWERTFEILAR